MKKEVCCCLRGRVVEFLIQSAQELQVSPIVKYSALSLFADRFYPSLSSRQGNNDAAKTWLLQPPLRESNLQLFALAALWISTKIHDSPPLHVKCFKSLADNTITEQHFTTKDFLEAELVLMQVLKFEIGMLRSIAFRFLEDLNTKLREVARVGEQLNIEACMDIMDLLYEKGEISSFNTSPRHLAASIMVAAYLITVPVQKSEFPILLWVKFVTSCNEEDILDTVRSILMHVFEA
ncbi:PREDICTED: cyclin-J18 [Nicotiana attenuata]|uniref:Cyclin-j18 n=1 Tax=Nicotiana attenuata TaxID=49451 RepID=A0A1J6IUD4_NICAT|nr:PREDICTED: cyclin-J18 [Nicotiana attenuata]OIT04200.1 cyclin-j18 [Nicotiana attenuata]